MIQTEIRATREQEGTDRTQARSIEQLTEVQRRAQNSQLALLDEAQSAIQKATTVREAKEIKDRAEAIEVYAKRAEYGTILAQKCVEIRLRAERKAGELLSQSHKHKGGKPVTHGDRLGEEEPPTLDAIGVTKNQSMKWQQIATIPEDKFEEAVGDAKSEAELIRLARRLAAPPQQEPEPASEPPATRDRKNASPFHPTNHLRGCYCGPSGDVGSVTEETDYIELFDLTAEMVTAFEDGDQERLLAAVDRFKGTDVESPEVASAATRTGFVGLEDGVF